MTRPTSYIFGGRFQPFHMGHFEFLKYLVKKTQGPIVIGIVNPDPKNTWPGDGADWIRFAPKDNPLNFWERLTCIRLCIENTSLAQRVEAIVPLPRPSVNLERANQFLPPKPRCFALCERWGDEIEKWKAESYERNGEEVFYVRSEVLPPPALIAEGTFIRSLIALGSPSWELLMPEPAAHYIKQLGLQTRLASGLEKSEARRIVQQFCSNHPLGAFATEILEGLDGPAEEASHDTSPQSRRKRIHHKLYQNIQTPTKEVLGETTVLLDSTERDEMERIIASLVRAGRVKVTPQILSVSRDLHQAVMIAETKHTLLDELRKHI